MRNEQGSIPEGVSFVATPFQLPQMCDWIARKKARMKMFGW